MRMRKLTLLWAWKIWAYCRVSSSGDSRGRCHGKRLPSSSTSYLSSISPSHRSTPLIFFTSEILLMAGVLVGVSLERLVGDIPQLWWAVFIW